MYMKTCGEEDAISNINGSMGERGNEEFIPAWAGSNKAQEPEIRPWIQSTPGEEKKRWRGQ